MSVPPSLPLSANPSPPWRDAASVSGKFFFWLDEPQDWRRPVQRVRLAGWCVAKEAEPVTRIRARIGRKTFDGRFDRERRDVADYIGCPDAPIRCGFTVDVRVPWRKARLELQAATTGGPWRKVFARDVHGPFLRSAEEKRAWKERERARWQFWFDRPITWERLVGRKLYLSGWCVDLEGKSVRAIRARIGRRKFAGNYGFYRPDVGEIYPHLRFAPESGFAIFAEPPVGRSDLVIEIKSAGHRWREVFSRTIEASDITQEPLPSEETAPFRDGAIQVFGRFASWVHRPGKWEDAVRYLRLEGWCFARDGEEITQIRACIRRQRFAATYPIMRPDVALAHERRPGSLRSGFAVDVIVPRGRSELVLEARRGQGNWEPFFAANARGPFAWGAVDEQTEIGNYPAWVRRYDSLSRADRMHIHRKIAAFARRPIVSLLLPVYNPDLGFLRRAIESVREQLYPDWQLCIADDASADPRVCKLLERYARRDRRIQLVRRMTNGHISAASNDALALATGEFIALLDHDDELAPTALYFVARELARDQQLRLLYSDEDKLDAHGRRDPHFKPDWNPDLFTSQNYISHLGVYSAALVRQVGGFRLGFEGAQDYDLAWRCIEKINPAQICHIPHVLYHWRAAGPSTAAATGTKTYALGAARRAVQEHFERVGIAATVEPERDIYLHARYPLPAARPLVSVIIATRDRAEFLRRTVESIYARTDDVEFEIIVVDNGSQEPDALACLDELRTRPRLGIYRQEGEFNFSRLNNFGAAQARGTFLALLNNDLEVISREWLAEMVRHAARPEIGAVGARLWYPNGTLQHAGVILGAGGIGSHAHAGLGDAPGYFSRAQLTQNFSAVTGACMVLRREVYEQLGGLDETNLTVAFNDVDFCLRLHEAGLRIVWTPHAQLFHYESASRGFEDTASKRDRFLAEVAYMHARWGPQLQHDPAYNPNLSLGAQLFTLALPPRVSKPWKS